MENLEFSNRRPSGLNTKFPKSGGEKWNFGNMRFTETAQLSKNRVIRNITFNTSNYFLRAILLKSLKVNMVKIKIADKSRVVNQSN